MHLRATLVAALLPLGLAQISDDFESGWDQSKWPIYAADCNQGGTVSLDSTTAHSGKNSIKVTSPGGYCGHIFFGSTSVPSGDVYVRVWMRLTNTLTPSHISFITMPDTTTSKHLRIGGQNSILMYNRESDDATLPDLSPHGSASSASLPTGSFQCFEYHLGTDGTIETWLNGTPVPGLQAGPNAGGNAYNKQWGTSYKPRVTGVYFGWESYGGDSNTVWYDDVAVAGSRVGCGAATPSNPSTSSASSGSTSTRVTTTLSTSTKPATTTTKTPTTMTSSATGPQQT
ncbi:carbohydrate-binding module family 1 protein [Coniochaeta sp. 2T2.1]|nr:carbohydrate-binding module family 1 protein [Coniochaeta sp. 2T2.1]